MSYFPSKEIQVYVSYLFGDILKAFTRLECSRPNILELTETAVLFLRLHSLSSSGSRNKWAVTQPQNNSLLYRLKMQFSSACLPSLSSEVNAMMRETWKENQWWGGNPFTGSWTQTNAFHRHQQLTCLVSNAAHSKLCSPQLRSVSPTTFLAVAQLWGSKGFYPPGGLGWIPWWALPKARWPVKPFLRLPSITVPQLCHFYFSWASSTALLHLSGKENVIPCHCLESVHILELLIRLDFKGETELSPLNSSVPFCLLRRINFDSKAIFEFISSE